MYCEVKVRMFISLKAPSCRELEPRNMYCVKPPNDSKDGLTLPRYRLRKYSCLPNFIKYFSEILRLNGFRLFKLHDIQAERCIKKEIETNSLFRRPLHHPVGT